MNKYKVGERRVLVVDLEEPRRSWKKWNKTYENRINKPPVFCGRNISDNDDHAIFLSCRKSEQFNTGDLRTAVCIYCDGTHSIWRRK